MQFILGVTDLVQSNGVFAMLSMGLLWQHVVLCEREKVNQNPSLRGWFVVKQIILNYLVIFVLPLISGGCVRFFCRKRSKAWLVTVAPALLAIAAYVAACNPPVLGSELYGLQTVQLCCFTIASLIVGLIFRKKKK